MIFSTTNKSDMLNEVKAYFNTQKNKQPINAFCNEIGISRGTFYDVLNGQYDKVSSETAERLIDLLPKKWNLVETDNYKQIRGAVKKAAQMGDMNCICGDTGTGKTASAVAVSKSIENVIYVLADKTMTQVAFLDAILQKLTSRSYEYRGITTKVKAIIKLLKMKKNTVLLIDDAGKLREKSIALVQVLFDNTKGEVGYVLLGTENLYHKVASRTANNAEFMREFNARVTWLFLDYVREDDIKAIARQNGIEDEPAQVWLSNAIVALHTLESIIKTTKAVAEKQGLKITVDLLEKLNGNNHWFRPESLNFKDRLRLN